MKRYTVEGLRLAIARINKEGKLSDQGPPIIRTSFRSSRRKILVEAMPKNRKGQVRLIKEALREGLDAEMLMEEVVIPDELWEAIETEEALAYLLKQDKLYIHRNKKGLAVAGFWDKVSEEKIEECITRVKTGRRADRGVALEDAKRLREKLKNSEGHGWNNWLLIFNMEDKKPENLIIDPDEFYAEYEAKGERDIELMVKLARWAEINREVAKRVRGRKASWGYEYFCGEQNNWDLAWPLKFFQKFGTDDDKEFKPFVYSYGHSPETKRSLSNRFQDHLDNKGWGWLPETFLMKVVDKSESTYQRFEAMKALEKKGWKVTISKPSDQ